jgi:hypothetical protein
VALNRTQEAVGLESFWGELQRFNMGQRQTSCKTRRLGRYGCRWRRRKSRCGQYQPSGGNRVAISPPDVVDAVRGSDEASQHM